MINQITNKIFNNISTLNNPIWLKSFWGNSIADYAIVLVIFAVFLVLLKLVQVILLRYLKKFSEKTSTDIDDTFVNIIGSVNPPFYSFLAFYLAILFLNISVILSKVINVILLVWIIYQVIIAIQILIDYIINKKFLSKTEDKGSAGVAAFISGLLKASLWAIGLLLILSNLGINITSLVAGLGIGGLAIAFALQNILGDLFSSLAIYIDKPFQVGDFIALGENKGTVEKIGVKTTRIRSAMGEEIVISNTELTSVRIQNYGRLKERRNVFTIGVTYDTPVEKMKKIQMLVKNAIESEESTRFDRVHFSSFGDSALNFDVSYFVESNNYQKFMDIKQGINFKILESFQKEGIEFAYPTQTVYIQKSA